MAMTNLGDALDRLTVLGRNGVWRSLCHETVEVPAILNPSTIHEEIVALAKQAGFMAINEQDVEKVSASHEVSEEELVQMQEERIRTDAEHESERPECEAIREMETKHLRELLATTGRCSDAG
ncbi:hypothetical protein M514_10656 [Trichuris suis]|uniref:Uncharacterized protein n=1 Tax=Trichuris suis TaxID=68888 RepID=A0A085MY01_9BILA|nr:hypothetical protein M513_10656 [Trichuris suis]KFD62097.1 hypothetical protein M514_10656 [Trichuris suis]